MGFPFPMKKACCRPHAVHNVLFLPRLDLKIKTRYACVHMHTARVDAGASFPATRGREVRVGILRVLMHTSSSRASMHTGSEWWQHCSGVILVAAKLAEEDVLAKCHEYSQPTQAKSSLAQLGTYRCSFNHLGCCGLKLEGSGFKTARQQVHLMVSRLQVMACQMSCRMISQDSELADLGEFCLQGSARLSDLDVACAWQGLRLWPCRNSS